MTNMKRMLGFVTVLTFLVSTPAGAGDVGAGDRLKNSTPILPGSQRSPRSKNLVDRQDRPARRSVEFNHDAGDERRLARRRKKSRKRRRVTPPAKPAPTPAPVEAEPAPSALDAAPAPIRRNGPSRIEFDDRLIQGQTNKANAIYLFERRASELRTLVKKRRHYHQEIDETLD